MTDLEQLELMTDSLVHGRIPWSVARKMSGDVARLSERTGNYGFIRLMLVSGGNAASVAISALDLCPALPSDMKEHVARHLDHSRLETRNMAMSLLDEM